MKTAKMISIPAILLVATATSLVAMPPGRKVGARPNNKTVERVDDFASLMKGEKIGFVCLECHTVPATEVESREDAQALCKKGGDVVCPACKKTYKIVRHGPPGKTHKHREVKYVNAEGKECAFITALDK